MGRQTSRASGARRTSSSTSGRPAPAPLHSSPPSRQAAASPPAPHQPTTPASPAPAAPPAVAGGGGGFLSNMMGTVASGMASGVGFGVAQRAVDAVLGPRKTEVVHTTQGGVVDAPPQAVQHSGLVPQTFVANPCQSQTDDLNQCMSRHSDMSLCQNYFDALKSCQTNMGGRV